MSLLKKYIFLFLVSNLVVMLYFAVNVFARGNNEIEVYKIGNNSITIKWTPYDSGGQPLAKYSIGYRVYGDAAYTYIDVDASTQSPDYNIVNNEFTKKITGLSSGTIYEIKLDVYLQGNPVPVSFYTSIKTMTKIVIDKTVTAISNPYGNDNVGHIDFAFVAPNESVGGILSSVDSSNITGYSLLVSASQGEIYSSGQPYKVLCNNVTGKYEIFRVTTSDEPLTYNGTQFAFNSQVKDGKDLLAFSLYKTNQPSQDNFELAKIYYVIVKPIFKAGTPYENIIVNATANYETIETIATLLPLTVSQIENDLIELKFPKVGTGSMSYDIYRGRLPDTLTKIHTEYDDGSRTYIRYFNKITDPMEGDVYYFKVGVSEKEINSKIIPITISLTPNIAPVINNIQIEKVIADTVNKSADIIISWDKPQNEDTYKDDLIYRFYLNTDSKNQVYDNDVIYDISGNILLDPNGKIVLNTKKDINNNNILFKGYPVVFERIAEISPNNLIGSDMVYTGSDPVGNFLATGQNYYRIIRNGQEVVRIIYRINGTDFLSNPDVPTLSGQPHIIYTSNLEGELATDYKNKIELNTTYFIKMDSYNASIGQSSDYSLTVSFTTPSDIVDTVPVPENFEVELIETQKIGLVCDMLNSSLYNDADVTYEVFVSENNSYAEENFVRIKNPNIITQNGKKHILIDTTYTLENDAVKQVEPNKVYLFKIRAKWNTQDDKGNNISIYSRLSKIVPVTTKREALSDPNVNTPLAPTDFTLTNVSSKSASFQWKKVDEFSTYRIVKTTEPIEPFAPLSVTGDGVTGNFALNGNIYSYTDTELSSNTLYYFSIRAEVIVDGQVLFSRWITLPVTTVLVEQPTELALVSRSPDGHSITISWKGKANLNYEAARKDDNSTSYQLGGTVNGDPNASGDRTFQLTLNNLKSNTRYLIKVRAKDPKTGMFSKYTEPIEVRTEFNQTDYNTEIDNKEKVEQIINAGKEWLQSPVEVIGDQSENMEIWIKSEKASHLVENSPDSNYLVDLNSNVNNKSVYIPLDLVDTLHEKNNVLQIKMPQGNIYFKPDILNSDYFSAQLNNSLVKNKVVKVQINKLSDTMLSIPKGDYIASEVLDISFKLIGYNKTSEELNASIAETVNNIINIQKNIAPYRTVEQIKEELEDEISKEVKNLIDRAFVAETSIILPDNQTIRIDCSFNLDKSGKSSKYVAYIKKGQTLYEIQGQIIGNGKIQFNTPVLGKLVILGKRGPNDISGNWAEQSIKTLISKYDFSNEISNGKFRPNDIASKKEAINFIINVLSPSGKEFNELNVIQKAEKLGILEEFPIWNMDSPITREELAYLVSKAYNILTGVDTDNVIISGNIILLDDQNITSKYKNSVYQMLNLNIIESYPQNVFYPGRQVTRAEVADTLVNLLEVVK